MATIDSLVVEIDGKSAQATQGIDGLIRSLRQLQQTTVGQLKGLNNISKGLGSLSGVMKDIAELSAQMDDGKIQNLNAMTNALMGLYDLSGLKLSTSIANQIKSIGEATRGLEGTNYGELERLGSALSGLTGIQKAGGLNSIANTLLKIPDAIKGINEIDSTTIATFTQRVEKLRKSIVPLADEMRAVSAGFSALPSNIQKAIKANQKLTQSNNATSRSTASLLKNTLRLGTAYYGFRKLFSFAMSAFTESNNFVESLNLAEVAMGEFADEASRYADTVESIIGINQSEWITSMGTFNQMLAGFGIDPRKTSQMSQQLVQLGYDIQSAFNVSDITSVMNKLQSGITGQIKGMREYGVELSVAAMQEYALSKGITQSWNSMSQAQKVALRYSKIMESTKNIQGDLARTIATPANSIRLLNSQWTAAQRYMGQFVSVIAARVIPIVQTMVSVISAAARALASLWGYALPSLPAVSGTAGAFNDVADSLDDVSASAGGAGGKMKGLLADFDELNIIQSQSGGGGGGAAALDAVGDLWDLTGYAYDFLDGVESKTADIMNKISDWWNTWHNSVAGFLASIIGYKLGSKIYDIAKNLGMSEKSLKGMKEITTGLVFAITGITLSWDGINDIVSNGLNAGNVLATIAGTIADIFGFSRIAAGINTLTGSNISTLKFGIGVALAIDGIALSYAATKKMATEGIDAAGILSDVGGAIVAGIGVGVVSLALGTGFPIAIALGAIATVTVGIGAVALYQALTAQELAKNAFIASGEGGFKPSEVIDALEAEFKERSRPANLVIEAYSNVDSIKDSLNSAAESINLLNEAVFGEYAPTTEEIEAIKSAWADFDSTFGNLSESTFNTMFDGLNAVIDSEYTYLSDRAADYQKTLIMMQTGMNEWQAQNAIRRDKVLDDILAGKASEADKEWYARYSKYMSTSEEQRRWEQMMQEGFVIDFSDNQDALSAAKQYVSDVQSVYDDLISASQEAIKAFESAVGDKKYELFSMFDMGDISEVEYMRGVEELEGMLETYRQFVANENEVARMDVANLYTSLLGQMLSDDQLSSFDGNINKLYTYLDEYVYPLMNSIEEAGILSQNQIDIMDELAAVLGGWAIAPFGEENTFMLRDEWGASTGQTLSDWVSEMLSQINIEESGVEVPAPDVNEFESVLQNEIAYTQAWNEDIVSASSVILPPADISSLTSSFDSAYSYAIRRINQINSLTRRTGALPAYGPVSSGAAPQMLQPVLSVPIPAFAGGGFPTEGQLFIANERGPELVGQIGSQTAVANSDQIVQSVTAGVSTANSRLEAKMDEFIRIGRQLLAKDNNVVLQPSAAMGRVVQKSSEMYQRARG